MTDAQGQVPEADSVRKAIRRAALLTAGAGIAYGVLVIVAWFLMAGERDALREAADSSSAARQQLRFAGKRFQRGMAMTTEVIAAILKRPAAMQSLQRSLKRLRILFRMPPGMMGRFSM